MSTGAKKPRALKAHITRLEMTSPPRQSLPLPVNIAWQARMGELLAVAHDYSADGADASLPVVWQL